MSASKSCANNAKTIIVGITSLIEYAALSQHLCTPGNPTALLLTRDWLDVLGVAKHQQADKVTMDASMWSPSVASKKMSHAMERKKLQDKERSLKDPPNLILQTLPNAC